MPGRRPRVQAKEESTPGVSSPSYRGRKPASERASAAARGSSKKTDTSCELLLRRALWAAGLRYRKNVHELPGHPDIVFPGAKVAIFCDGDFWHGRNWESRRRKLETGNNAGYWIAKIERNMERDRQSTLKLEKMGWAALRFWESEIFSDLPRIVNLLSSLLKSRFLPNDQLGSRRYKPESL